MAEEVAAAPEVVDEAPTPEATPASDDHWARQHDFTDEQIGKIQNKGWEGPASMFESYDKLEAMRGVSEDRLLKLPEVDDADGLKAVYQKLGTPEAVEGYKVEFPEGTEIDTGMHDRFKEASLGANLTAEQHNAVVQFQVAEASAQAEAHETAAEQQNAADMVELKNKWGSKTEERLDYGRRAAEKMGFSEEDITAMQSVVGGVKVADHFAKLGDMLGEDSIAQGSDTPSFGTSPEQVDAEIADIMGKFLAEPELMAKHQLGLSNPKGIQIKETKRLEQLYKQHRSFIKDS